MEANRWRIGRAGQAAAAAWPAWRHARSTAAGDAALALAMLVLTVLPGTGQLGASIGDLPVRRSDGAAVALVALLVLPLAVRQRYPGWCAAVVGGAFAAYELLGYAPAFATLAGFAALYSAGAHLERGRAWVAGGAAAGCVLLAIALRLRGSPDGFSDFVLFFLIFAACWAAGAAVRAWRRGEADRERDRVAAAMSQERARIARELHDIVTHHVTAMVIQAEATQYLVGQAPDRAGTGLAAIGETGRRALADLRDLLTVLRAPEPAQSGRLPALSQLAELVERTRAAGQPVELIEEGTPRHGSDGVDLAAYRVIQESLTNALKHAPGRQTVIRVGHRSGDVRIEVTTAAGPGGPGQRPARRAGHGLLGLSERVGLYGGQLHAGPAPDGSFRVQATIPRPGNR